MIHHTDCLEFMRGMVERGERVDAITGLYKKYANLLKFLTQIE